MVAAHPELADLCGALIDLANERGGPDNITVVAAHFDGDGLPEPSASRGRGIRGLSPARRRRADEPSRPPCRTAVGGRRAATAPSLAAVRVALLLMARGALPDRRAAGRLALTSRRPRPGSAPGCGWVAALSFASGLPYFFFNETVPVWLAASGMSLGGHRPGLRRVPAMGAQVPLGAAGRSARQLGACGSGSASACSRWHRGARRCRPRAARRAARGAPARVRRRSRRRRTSRSTPTPSRPRTAASSASRTRCGSRRTGARAS